MTDFSPTHTEHRTFKQYSDQEKIIKDSTPGLINFRVIVFEPAHSTNALSLVLISVPFFGSNAFPYSFEHYLSSNLSMLALSIVCLLKV